tara:strand:+ start:500 stop:739 length:240 start_codon:yes stop_codon:yes gene_type:complete
MNQSNRKKKTQKQLEISKLDEMLWLSTPLGKLMNSINKKTRKVFLSSRPNKYIQRAWVFASPMLLSYTNLKTLMDSKLL